MRFPSTIPKIEKYGLEMRLMMMMEFSHSMYLKKLIMKVMIQIQGQYWNARKDLIGRSGKWPWKLN
ncbi:unnamed protein product [Arabidopsis halleri]